MLNRILMFFCILLFLGIAENVYAEDSASLLPPNKHFAVDWVKKLKLTDMQKAQLDAIYAESRPQIETLKQQMITLRQQMANIRAEDEKKIRAILDEKQAAKFDKIQARFTKQNRAPQPRHERRQRFKMRENNI